MAEYFRVKKDGNKAYFVDPEGNRLNDVDVQSLASTLNQTTTRPAFLYIGESWDEEGLYKVGFSHEPKARANRLEIWLDFCFEAFSYGDLSGKYFEDMTHRLFKAAGLHKEGEWFHLEKEDVEIIKILLARPEFSFSKHYRLDTVSKRFNRILDCIEGLTSKEEWGSPEILDGLIYHINNVLDVADGLTVDQTIVFAYLFQALSNCCKGSEDGDDERAIKYCHQFKSLAIEWSKDHPGYKYIAGKQWKLADNIA